MHSKWKLSILLLLSVSFFFCNSRPTPRESVSPLYTVCPDLSTVKPLFGAYSHNDYKNEKPLLDALSHGFIFIETDIHLIDDELYVNHEHPKILYEKNNLSTLYLDPLFELYHKNAGRIFPQTEKPLCLVIDIKTEAEKTFLFLEEVLKKYHPMLTHWKNEQQYDGAVTIIISGLRPIELIVQQSERWVCLDGRPEDLGNKYSNLVMPMISEKYTKVLGLHFLSDLPSKRKFKYLKKLTDKAHKEGKQFRLWRSYENELLWDKMLANGADIINTDSLNLLADYFSKEKNDPKIFVEK